MFQAILFHASLTKNNDTDTGLLLTSAHGTRVIIFKYRSLYGDGMDVILFVFTFRETQMDINNSMMAKGDKSNC